MQLKMAESQHFSHIALHSYLLRIGRHHFTRDCEYDARRARAASLLPLLKDEPRGKESQGEPDTICRRFLCDGKLKRTPGTRSQTSCGAIHERTRLGTLSRENGHHA